MNDSKILGYVMDLFKAMVVLQQPMSPSSAATLIDAIETSQLGSRHEKMAADVYNSEFDGGYKQNFWRCKHYPSAIDNYYGKSVNHGGIPYLLMRSDCDLGCSKPPTWYSNGMMTERRETPRECKPAT